MIKNQEQLNQGAGIQTAKKIIDSGADMIITGSCGPKAFRVLKEANMDISLNAVGRVIDVIQQYKNGIFSKASKPNSMGREKTESSECADAI